MKLLVIFLGVLVACGTADAPARQPLPDPPPSRDPIAADARELVTAVIDDWSSTKATLRRYRRAGDRWELVGQPWPGVIGKQGAAWGDGLHGKGAPAGRGGLDKREGDGKSPAGAFAIGTSYGYAGAAPAGTKLPYRAVNTNWKCVDDPTSAHYNQILEQTTVRADWSSAEEMRRADDLYTWVIDVAHNRDHVPRHGSCIFLHVWGGPESATAGCTAMAEPVLADLVATLDPSTVFVLLPKAEYTALTATWKLPAL